MRREITKDEWEYIWRKKPEDINPVRLEQAAGKNQDTWYPAMADLKARKSPKYVAKKYNWKLETAQMLRDWLLAKGELKHDI